MNPPRVVLAGLLALTLSACGSKMPRAPLAPAEQTAKAERLGPRSPEERLQAGLTHLEASRYRQAEASFRPLLDGQERGRAQLGLARVQLATGRYAEVEKTLLGFDRPCEDDVIWTRAEAQRRQGRLDQALSLARKADGCPKARRTRVLLGELLIEAGRRGEAEAPLSRIIDAYNQGEIQTEDGPGLALVGRAAHLLRSPRDANDAFNEAEQVLVGDTQTLLWRAELFLEKYDPGHAEEVARELLEKAPNHPEALLVMAHVKLAQTYDFDEAARLAKQALQVNPNLTDAYFVLGGIALRDMELGQADRLLDRGLTVNERDLKLLSLKAAVRFLGDDEAGFREARDRVWQYNREYSTFYQIVGEYAEWEHRYQEIIPLMREAVLVDADDAKVRADLGLNLIRAGEDTAGVESLRAAFARDPYNVRVYNTLNLFEKVIPSEYVTVEHGVFRIRYHRSQRSLLERYVPPLLEQAWEKMVAHYGLVPVTPVGVELYPEREHFAVRTSGLPNIGIQGVCFGRTFASMTPGGEEFNLGMTVWHELSHVFHIELSKARVPRWFTEGLAEWETLTARPEWKREHDADLYDAIRHHRLPPVVEMNRAFTRAEDMADMTTAYYAASQIAVMLSERYGPQKIQGMLRRWAQGRSTPEVLAEVLGADAAQLDEAFRGWARERLSRYEGQFVPLRRTGSLDAARLAAKRAPKDPRAQSVLALAELQAGHEKAAEAAVRRARSVARDYPDALWVEASLRLGQRQWEPAERLLDALIQAGHDGLEVQLALAEIRQEKNDLAGMKTALEKAHRYDPTSAVALEALAHLARETHQVSAEIAALERLAKLSEHDARVVERLMRLLIDEKRLKDAIEVGRAAIYVDITGMRTHQLYAEALAMDRQFAPALFELESALLCPGEPREKADVHAQMAETYQAMGRPVLAKNHASEAQRLDPENPRLQRFGR